jgi:hypothetical protein
MEAATRSEVAYKVRIGAQETLTATSTRNPLKTTVRKENEYKGRGLHWQDCYTGKWTSQQDSLQQFEGGNQVSHEWKELQHQNRTENAAISVALFLPNLLTRASMILEVPYEEVDQ